jgi:hypothetical protein
MAPPDQAGLEQGNQAETLQQPHEMGPHQSEPQEESMAGRNGRAVLLNKTIPEESKRAESRIRVITLEAARLRKELRESEAKRQRAGTK